MQDLEKENLICSPMEAYIKCRRGYKLTREEESLLLNDPHWTFHYIINIKQKHWVKGEKILFKSSFYGREYAKLLLFGKN